MCANVSHVDGLHIYDYCPTYRGDGLCPDCDQPSDEHPYVDEGCHHPALVKVSEQDGVETYRCPSCGFISVIDYSKLPF